MTKDYRALDDELTGIIREHGPDSKEGRAAWERRTAEIPWRICHPLRDIARIERVPPTRTDGCEPIRVSPEAEITVHAYDRDGELTEDGSKARTFKIVPRFEDNEGGYTLGFITVGEDRIARFDREVLSTVETLPSFRLPSGALDAMRDIIRREIRKAAR